MSEGINVIKQDIEPSNRIFFPEFSINPDSKSAKLTEDINFMMTGMNALDTALSISQPTPDQEKNPLYIRWITKHSENVLNYYELLRLNIALIDHLENPDDRSAAQFEKTLSVLSKTDQNSWRSEKTDDTFRFFHNEEYVDISLQDIHDQMRVELKKSQNKMSKSFQEQETTFGGTVPVKEKSKQSISITEEDASLLLVKLRMTAHELGAPITMLQNYQLLERVKKNYPDHVPAIIQDIREGYSWVQQITEKSKKIFSDLYSKTPMNIESVRKHLNSSLARGLPKKDYSIHFDKSLDTLGHEQVLWDESFVQLLGETIAQNTVKAYQDKPGLNAEDQSITVRAYIEGDYIYIGFADKGNGFNDKVLKKGFLKNVGGWINKNISSNRVGLSTHKEILHRMYNAELYPTNRFDKDGTVIGGEPMLRIPRHT